MVSRKSYICSSVGVAKSVTIIIGIIVVIIGLRSHFQSAWIKYDLHNDCKSTVKGYCPDILMERFYVAIVPSCLVLSSLGFILCTFRSVPFNIIFWICDVTFHGLTSVLLLIAGILYIISAIKIDRSIANNKDSHEAWKYKEIVLGKQKIIAGVLTILLSLVYLICLKLVKRSRTNFRSRSESQGSITSTRPISDT